MAMRRNQYARAYSFGTDGSAALAGNPISSHRPLATRPAQKKQRFVLRAPRIVLIAVFVFLGFYLLNMVGNSLDEQTLLERQIAQQQVALSDAQHTIADLDAKLLEAANETRIRSAALNRLGMQAPLEAQVQFVPRPQVYTEADLAGQRASGGASLFQALLKMIGL